MVILRSQTVAAVLLAAATVCTGCGTAASGSPPADAPTPTTVPAPALPTAPPTPVVTTPVSTDPGDCVDADCTVAVRAPARIPLDAATYYYPVMLVSAVSTTEVELVLPFPDGTGTTRSTLTPDGPAFTSGNPGSTQLIVAVVSIADGQAVLRVSHS